MTSRAGAVLTLDEVRRHRTELTDVGVRHRVQSLRVFGFVARGESDEASDLDLLVDVVPGHGLLALSTFAGEVEEQLHVVIQVATVNGLKPRIRDRVIA